jgi:hypothetical protein
LIALIAASPAASAACSGNLASLQSSAGSRTAETNLLATPPIAARLAALPRRLRDLVHRSAGGTIDLVGCHLVVSGSTPHRGGDEASIVDVDLASGRVTVATHSHGVTDIYLDRGAGAQRGSYADVPAAVRTWALLADMGFPYQQPRTVRIHPAAP